MADVINVGAAPNDNAGDLLRDGFRKVNTRLQELLGTLSGGQPWATATTYTATPLRQWVMESGQAYVAVVNHTSGVFATDLAAGKWLAVDVAQLSADLAKTSGSTLVGTIASGAGAVARTVQDKGRDFVSIFDYCTTAQIADIRSNTGALDVSAAWQAALDAAGNNAQIDLGGGTHKLSSAVSRTGLSRLRIVGRGAKILEGTPGTAALVSFTNCDRLRFDDAHFVGAETYTYFQANSPATRKRFLSITTSHKVRIKDVTGEGKRGHILLTNCNAGIVEGSDFVGFFQNVSLGAQANANECPSIEFSGGRQNKAFNNHAENHGSCVLWGSDAEAPTVFGNTGKNLHDNGVYGSSGTRARAFANDFVDIVGSAVKLRGSQNLGFGNTSKGTGTGAAFTLTGNGVTPDAYGTNGFGNMMVFNSASDVAADGISYGAQDGYYARDSVISFNTLNNITATGGYGALRGTLRQGGILVGNVGSQLACDYGMLHSGGASDPQKATVLFGNVFANLAGAQQGMRVTYMTESLIGGNVGTGVTNLVQGRNCTHNVFLSNVNPNGTTALGATSGNSNANNVVVGHRGAVSVDGATHLTMSNYPSGTLSPIASTPPAIGATTVASGVGYIATGIASAADWKQITP